MKPFFAETGDILCDFDGTECIFKNPQNNAFDWIKAMVIMA